MLIVPELFPQNSVDVEGSRAQAPGYLRTNATILALSLSMNLESLATLN